MCCVYQNKIPILAVVILKNVSYVKNENHMKYFI